MEKPGKEFYQITTIDGKRKPNSTDYYSVTVLTMIIMYSSITGLSSIRKEKNLKTGNRILCSPAKKHEILIGKVMGCIVVTVIQALTVLLFSKLVLNAYWGTNIGAIMALLSQKR